MRDPDAPRPRRLTLSGTEIELLRRRAEVTLPPGFGTGADVAETALRAAVAALARRGVVEPAESGDPLECQVHPSVLANLSVLAARPRVLLRTEVSLGDTGSRAVHAVSGPLGASLFALADDAVELSMFAARDLGRELVRAVPPVEAEAGRGGIVDVLSGTSGPAAPPRGRLPLAALENVGPALAFGGDAGAERAGAELGLSREELALAREVTARTTGVLRCLVIGPSGDQDTVDGLLAGQVVWFATDAGWVGLEPDPDPRRMVRLVPVAREDIGTWVAPYVAGELG